MTWSANVERTARWRRSAPLVVLGCRLAWSGERALEGALGRRVSTALLEFERLAGCVVVTGGRTWDGIVEADAMRDDLERRGVPGEQIVRERCSLTTRGNAHFVAHFLRRIGVDAIRLVTCDWHMPRARALFQRERLDVAPLPAVSPPPRRAVRLYREAHELISERLWREA